MLKSGGFWNDIPELRRFFMSISKHLTLPLVDIAGYEQMYVHKVQIPLKGHHVSLEPFAFGSDPDREEYYSDYILPSRYFDCKD